MIPEVPYSRIKEFYGEPIQNGDFTRMRRVHLPFPMRLSWDDQKVVEYIYCNPVIAVPLVEALTEIREYYGIRMIEALSLNTWGGCHNYRERAGGGRLSVHAWGMAVDYVPQLGLLGQAPMTPYPIVRAFTKRGFYWGGDFDRRDGMHFTGINEWR